MSAAVAALAQLSDHELGGSLWPLHVATAASFATLGVTLPAPWLCAPLVDTHGQMTWAPIRPIGPGD
jgi:hypothetical protein